MRIYDEATFPIFAAFLIEIQKEETWINLPTYNWWDGWWKCKPRNIMEILIEMIWKRLNIEGKIAGFEYWSKI